MIRHILSISRFAFYRPAARLGLLLRLDASYRSYWTFRDLPPERLLDLGLSEQDQSSARFADFFFSPAHAIVVLGRAFAQYQHEAETALKQGEADKAASVRARARQLRH